MVSNTTTSWSCNITAQKVYNATVSYTSGTKNLSVSFTGYKEDVPFLQNLSYEIDLTIYLPEKVTFGFSAANGFFTSTHILRSWSFHSSDFTSKNSKIGLVIGLSIGVSVFIGALGLISFGVWKRKKKKSITDQEGEDDDELGIDLLMDNDFERNSGAKRFSYDELVTATMNFSEEEKLGQGGFGWVYRGFLKNMNSYVAIKKISTKSQQGIKEYASEVVEAADPRLCGEFNEQQMERLMIVGLWCAHPDHNLRPSIKQAMHVLDFEAPLPALPLEMPLPTYLPPSAPRSNYGSSSASNHTQTEFSTGNNTHCTRSSQFSSSFSQ
ncbi:hypothetical protein FEM48_Zijuj09G0087600 [Ziziphus jujuba var. spinosa]|uniref:Legume lectin domain-containing protein n=1 Tax=Ziziphus jujuba var. spinosa TaxID=714518 RepID=A0A978US05_ZIZJJ|nr:hypothetical protein FEM48_Zijuj09G0087600 [Ziziphus jujuba var. spinosa]